MPNMQALHLLIEEHYALVYYSKWILADFEPGERNLFGISKECSFFSQFFRIFKQVIVTWLLILLQISKLPVNHAKTHQFCVEHWCTGKSMPRCDSCTCIYISTKGDNLHSWKVWHVQDSRKATSCPMETWEFSLTQGTNVDYSTAMPVLGVLFCILKVKEHSGIKCM